MLYAALILSALLLMIANLAVHHRRYPIVDVGVAGAVFTFAPAFLMVMFPPVMLLAIGLPVAVLVWHLTRRGPWLFLPLSLLAALVAFGIAGHSVVERQQRYDDLRAGHPFESMEGRVPEPGPAGRGGALSAGATQRLEELEREVDYKSGTLRSHHLKQLHERTVHSFVNSPGFGVGRMQYPSRSTLAPERHEPVEQPRPYPPEPWSPVAAEPLPGADEADLHRTHRDAVVDFVNPFGFGYVKGRRQVAGFQAHQFSRMPDPTKRWAVAAIDLVGLLRHAEPVAYVSAHLPRMDELREAPTRPLDAFEVSGLAALHRGEDLTAGRTGDQVRMLGAVRSTKQCVGCHGGERGDLLGAFSYTLRPAGKNGTRTSSADSSADLRGSDSKR
jgi:hypothetical protein